VQYGAQPLLARYCIAPTVPTSSLVLSAEVAKIVGCAAVLHAQGRGWEVWKGWTLRGSVLAAGIPSITYLVQNYCTQIAYQNLDGLVFNILNQSKMLFTAAFSYLIVGRRQSRIQCVALALVLVAGTLISLSGSASSSGDQGKSIWVLGLACILTASALSGLGSGLTERTLQRHKRDSLLFTIEMAVYGILIIVLSLPFGLTKDGEVWRREGLFARWGPMTIVPVITQGWGGIVVGLITKVAGGVRKGFAVICGLLLTCLLNWLTGAEHLSPLVRAAVPLVAVSIYLHARHPPKPPRRE